MQKRITITILTGIIAILICLGIISNNSIQDSIRHSLEQRMEFATFIANSFDQLLQANISRLYDVSLTGAIDIDDGDWEPEYKALKTAYSYSLFSDGLFILNPQGDIVASYPPDQVPEQNMRQHPEARLALESGKSFISAIQTETNTQRKIIHVFAPLKDGDGKIIGILGAEINPGNFTFKDIMNTVPLTEETGLELVDANGMIIAANNPQRYFSCADRNHVLRDLIQKKQQTVMECHRCHQENPPLLPEKTTSPPT